jgi:hypothetical protein
LPIFYSDGKSFIALEGSGTDIAQRIQICQLQNDGFVLKGYIKLPKQPFIPMSYIFWHDSNTIFIANNSPKFKSTKFYKVNFDRVINQ